jgi:phospholipase C
MSRVRLILITTHVQPHCCRVQNLTTLQETPGCESTNLNCYPHTWKTAPELYQNAGVTWQVYQETDNFDDNPLAWFQQFQQASSGSPLGKRGMSKPGLDKFYSDAAAGTLPQVSYIIGPMELSEHPPYMPKDGAWLQRQIAEAVINSPKYNSTVLMISYDGKYLLPTRLVCADYWNLQRPAASVIMWYLITRHRVLRTNG